MEEDLTLRLVGNGIDPSKIKVGELGAILYHYERALKGIISSNSNGTIDEKKYYLTLEEVKRESAGYRVQAFSPNKDFNPALIKLDSIVANRNPHNVNEKTLDSLNKIGGWLRTHNCDAEFYSNGSLVTTIKKNFSIREEDYLLTEYSTLHGEIIDVGKLEPRIEIRLVSGESLFFDIKYNDAIELGKFLYKRISLTGKALIHPSSFRVHSFELEDWVIISDIPYSEKFSKLRGIVGREWDEIENPIEYLDSNG